MQKIIGTDTVKSVDEKYFKEGWNVFHPEPGKFMYIDYKSNVVRGFLLSDTTGIVRSSVFLVMIRPCHSGAPSPFAVAKERKNVPTCLHLVNAGTIKCVLGMPVFAPNRINSLTAG